MRGEYSSSCAGVMVGSTSSLPHFDLARSGPVQGKLHTQAAPITKTGGAGIAQPLVTCWNERDDQLLQLMALLKTLACCFPERRKGRFGGLLPLKPSQYPYSSHHFDHFDEGRIQESQRMPPYPHHTNARRG
jgi:hypothetical protein